MVLAREQQQRDALELSTKDHDERKERERQEIVEKAKFQSTAVTDSKGANPILPPMYFVADERFPLDYRPINFNNDRGNGGNGRYRFGQDRYKGRS